MKKIIPVSIVIMSCVLFGKTDHPCAQGNMEKIKNEQGAMNAVIERFARDKNICNDEEGQLTFAISPYDPSEEHSRWSEVIRKNISACTEKYMVSMERKGTRSFYLYCYDGQIPKLLAPEPDSSENRKNCSNDKKMGDPQGSHVQE